MYHQFFRLFLQGNYQEASRVEIEQPNSFVESHHFIAQILSNPDFIFQDLLSLPIDPDVIELVALRHEIGFSYKNALKLRQALQQRRPTTLNLLAMIDIELKIKPFYECNLAIIEETNLPYSRYLVSRILSITEFIVNNICYSALPVSLIEKSTQLFTQQLDSYPIYMNYSNLARLLFCFREYEKSLTYFRQSQELGDVSDLCQAGIIKCLSMLDRFSEAFSYARNLVNISTAGLLVHMKYAHLVGFFGKGDDSFEHLNISFSMLNAQLQNTLPLIYLYHSCGNLKLAIKHYYRVLSFIPTYNQLCSQLAGLLVAYDDEQPSIDMRVKETTQLNILSLCKNAAVSLPTSSESALAMAMLAKKSDRQNLSQLDVLIEARKLAPDSWKIASKLLEILGKDNFQLQESICLHFLKSFENFEHKFEVNIQLALVYLNTGFIEEVYQIADTFQDFLLNEADNAYLSFLECQNIYFKLGYIVPSIRDSILFNNLMLVTSSNKFKEKLYDWNKCIDLVHSITRCKKSIIRAKNIKRIGFISPHFNGHVVSILSIDVIKELSFIEGLEVSIIALDKKCKDSAFMLKVKEINSINFIEISGGVSVIRNKLIDMDIDILIDLDGLTSSFSPNILYSKPAIVNCTWLGFDAPYISEENYFLCDYYTHPEGVDEFYVEKLVRLPHSHMCVGSLDVVDKDSQAVRTELGLSDNQIVFIYPAAVRKFNFNIASAHAQILKQVPNSVLMVKTSGGKLDRPLEIWKEELLAVDVNPDRIISIPYAKNQNEHRFYFKVADIYLDAYPYNGGSQTLEALWCDLPVVTYCGEQSFARMGYSLLSTAGITEGIAHSWEEYIEWAVRLATDRDLRLSIKERLAKGKDPDNLCPLWNPKQFARDMYNILQELYEQAEA